MYKINNPQNKLYSIAIQKEITIENKSIGQIPDYSKSTELHPILRKYKNKQIINFDSDNEFKWYEIFLKFIHPVKKALTLGSGTGRHQLYLQKLGIVESWDSIDLVTDRNEGYTSKYFEIKGDLNFITLPEQQYDLVFCHGILHHIINLEHLLFEINKSLTHNGYFIVSEYIGENKWIWSDDRIRITNGILTKEFGKYFENYFLEKRSIRQMNIVRPLEAIRSEDICDVLDKTFYNSKIFEIKRMPFAYPVINSIPYGFKKKLLNDSILMDDFLNTIVNYDLTFYNNNELIFTELNGLYKKSNLNVKSVVLPWKRNEIKRNLGVSFGSIEIAKSLLLKIKLIKYLRNLRK